MAKPVDLELKKAFVELQVKMVETSKKIQVIDSQIGVLKRVLQHADITQREISTLPPETKTYESVGRMFLLTDLAEIKSNLSNRTALLTSRTVELENSKEYLEKNLKESENNIREMVQQKKEQSEAK
ncbi:prefoldin subunit 1-like [Pararge aegeria]|uniref:Jg26835 protein n=2 Tax=Pararge aegeria TaxID=116150 RepID=A0A8S4S8W1_9NEOP|nr:prefoldin subunit 1-like [Pararge aegeria]CAH2262219.1 jg26835 [Pararge aegeria aegeria]